MELGVLGGFAGFTGERLCRVYFLKKLWNSGVYFLLSSVCDILQIYKFRKNILNVICIYLVYDFVFLMFCFSADLVNLIKSNKKCINLLIYFLKFKIHKKISAWLVQLTWSGR